MNKDKQLTPVMQAIENVKTEMSIAEENAMQSGSITAVENWQIEKEHYLDLVKRFESLLPAEEKAIIETYNVSQEQSVKIANRLLKNRGLPPVFEVNTYEAQRWFNDTFKTE